MESIEFVILTPSMTNYHNKGPPTFNRNAESQRIFVLKNSQIVIAAIHLCGLLPNIRWA